MSMMSEVILDIRELVMEGIPTYAIATALNVPIEWVHDIKEVMESADEEL